jgi:hypothetical protein
VGVGEEVVHRLQASGVAIAEVRDLYWGGFASEDQQAVVGGVAGEVHEDIDLVFADERGRLRVGEWEDVPPVVGVLPEPGGYRIRPVRIAIVEDFDCGPIMTGQQSFHEECDRMIAKIR